MARNAPSAAPSLIPFLGAAQGLGFTPADALTIEVSGGVVSVKVNTPARYRADGEDDDAFLAERKALRVALASRLTALFGPPDLSHYSARWNAWGGYVTGSVGYSDIESDDLR